MHAHKKKVADTGSCFFCCLRLSLPLAISHLIYLLSLALSRSLWNIFKVHYLPFIQGYLWPQESSKTKRREKERERESKSILRPVRLVKLDYRNRRGQMQNEIYTSASRLEGENFPFLLLLLLLLLLVLCCWLLLHEERLTDQAH